MATDFEKMSPKLYTDSSRQLIGLGLSNLIDISF